MIGVLLLTACLAAGARQAATIDDAVDRVQFHSCYTWCGHEGDPSGKREWTEVIFWSGDYVREWRFDRGQFNVSPGVITWVESGRAYRIRYKAIEYTHGTGDPEVDNRELLPDTRRVDLGAWRAIRQRGQERQQQRAFKIW